MEFSNPMMTMPVTTTGDANGFGNNAWNNPFMYLIWLAIFRQGGFFGNGYGDPNAVGASTLNSAQVDAIRDTVAQIHSDVNCGNANGMRVLDQIANEARALGVAVTDINGNICDAKTAVLGALTALQYQSSQETASIVSAVKDCCCATQNKLDALGCGIEKQILNQTNSIQAGFNAIGNGISNLGYQLAQQDCGIKQLIASEGCQTRQLMRDLHTEDIITQKNTQIADLQGQIFKYSQAAQTAEIINALKTTTTTTTP
jgi:hypothetical protein